VVNRGLKVDRRRASRRDVRAGGDVNINRRIYLCCSTEKGFEGRGHKNGQPVL